ncbi:nucleotide triphosphate diphosphatase NUDT15 [Bradyrhizobium sp. CCBAU 65884]|uniref:nucleotide triphosphate diphosphatase NUDT15 n=1 Tax=Bradyrhizobium sp. CCBAU 65884 TaxID=722477 RepID=UPI002306D812|nr:NUDIX domain-containing protein [Bradyrhizobium sp. CCBAU 65884]
MKGRGVKIGVNTFVFREGRILLGKRLSQEGYKTWCLPGGHFEYGESLVDAAKRELEEETGIKATTLEFIQIVNQPRIDCHYVHVNFLAKVWRGTPAVMEPEKCSDWRWFELNNISEEIFIGHKQFIRAFIDKTTFVDNDSNLRTEVLSDKVQNDYVVQKMFEGVESSPAEKKLLAA